ncbi:CinA family protein [Bowmanella dokdonensis]|uniref:Nicotinamide-nucleotide amidohydrolase family protein n=1 Tax=Bowmanella dokdonensis TaxID=751969 RepID=A0A939IP46_9ALTE|nr:nicotinamide-nucleotide amidohydrolase family protein [Bowmanella dokdonensis]MBN7827053.1 nicotinamide-nucleotide amidohydrolase family protein [Bowmanella dokdonensis]
MADSSLSLAQQLGEALKSKGWKMTCAESCTGGGIGYAITSISGSSGWFERGYITYSNEAKTEVLEVDPQTLIVYGAVSEQAVEQMASGALKAARADLAVAVSGIAGPEGGSPEKPVGTVWFGIASANKVISLHQRFTGDRLEIRQQAIDHALEQALVLARS